MIVLITNSLMPYCFDVAHVLGLPFNLSHRFRYRERWISATGDLSKSTALVVLRNFSDGQLIPLRYVQISHVRNMGGMAYLDFRVQGFPSASTAARLSERLYRAISDRGYDNRGGAPLNALVVDVPEIDRLCGTTGDQVDDVVRWNEVLAEIGGIDSYKDYSFLKILRIEDAAGKRAHVVKDTSTKYAYALSPGTLYYLDVAQHVPWQVDTTERIEIPYDVELVAESDDVILLRKVQRVVGKYDLLRFIFKTPRAYASRHTFLEITDRQAGPGAQFRLPTLFLPVHVRPTKRMRAIAWGRRVLEVLSVGTFAAAGSLPWDPNLVRALSLLVLVIASKRWEDTVQAFVEKASDTTVKF